jgi:hypothetical protein
MDELNETLKQLVAEACSFPLRSADRQRCIQKIYRRVMNSRKIWKESSLYYNDALQETWEYCCQHWEDYDPSLSAVTTWINNRLQWTLRKWRDRQIQEQDRRVNPVLTNDGTLLEPINRVASNPGTMQAMEIWHTTLTWVQTDPDGVLQQTYFRKRREINAQALFLKRFPSETSWQEIAREFNLTPAEVKDLPKFYNRSCLPLLRSFGVTQGYLEEQK